MQAEHSIHIFINKKKVDLNNPVQTGASLKNLAAFLSVTCSFFNGPVRMK